MVMRHDSGLAAEIQALALISYRIRKRPGRRIVCALGTVYTSNVSSLTIVYMHVCNR